METLRIGPGVPARTPTPHGGLRRTAADTARTLLWATAWGFGIGLGITAWTMLGTLIR